MDHWRIFRGQGGCPGLHGKRPPSRAERMDVAPPRQILADMLPVVRTSRRQPGNLDGVENRPFAPSPRVESGENPLAGGQPNDDIEESLVGEGLRRRVDRTREERPASGQLRRGMPREIK